MNKNSLIRSTAGFGTLLAGSLLLASSPAIMAQDTAAAWQTSIIKPQVRSGSNASRAPLPSARPLEYRLIRQASSEATVVLAANHIGGSSNESDSVAPLPSSNYYATAPAAQPATVAEINVSPVGTMRGAPLSNDATATVALDANQMGLALRSESFITRDSLLVEIENRLDASERALGRMNTATARDLRDDLKAKGKAVRKSLKTARKATSQEWDAARMQLAVDYAAYADQAARADMTAHMPQTQR